MKIPRLLFFIYLALQNNKADFQMVGMTKSNTTTGMSLAMVPARCTRIVGETFVLCVRDNAGLPQPNRNCIYENRPEIDNRENCMGRCLDRNSLLPGHWCIYAGFKRTDSFGLSRCFWITALDLTYTQQICYKNTNNHYTWRCMEEDQPPDVRHDYEMCRRAPN